MKPLVLAVILAIAQASAPVPRKAPDGTASTSKGVQTNTSNDQTKTAKTEPAVKSQPTQDGEQGADRRARDNAEQSVRVAKLPAVSIDGPRRDWADWEMWTFNLLLAVTSGFQVWLLFKTLTLVTRQTDEVKQQRIFMGGQLEAMKNQIGQMESAGRQTDALIEQAKKQAEALSNSVGAMHENVEASRRIAAATLKSAEVAKASADAAQTTANAILMSERAHVDVALVPFNEGSAMHRIRLANYGRSHAEIVRLILTHHFLQKGAALPAQLPEGAPLERRRFNQLLPVGAPTDALIFDMRNYFETDEISGDRLGILRVRIDYADVFRKEERFTECVYFYDQDTHTLKNMPAYNKYT